MWGAVDGTEIDWKPKKNLCTEETRKKQKGGNKGGKKGGQVRILCEKRCSLIAVSFCVLSGEVCYCTSG